MPATAPSSAHRYGVCDGRGDPSSATFATNAREGKRNAGSPATSLFAFEDAS